MWVRIVSVAALLSFGLLLPPGGPASGVQAWEAEPSPLPLSGMVIVVDAGHQLGNHNFPRKINRLVPAGVGQTKPCNTTGTATRGAVAEATIAFQVAKRVKAKLEAQGARVVMTRRKNSQDLWGPCVNVRGLKGNVLADGTRADLKISVHADGSYAANAHGFHVIVPMGGPDATATRARKSLHFARLIKTELVARNWSAANYVAGGDGLDVRGDLATLNLSKMPSIMIEMGNLKSAGDARRLLTPRGQRKVASALVAAAITQLVG